MSGLRSKLEALQRESGRRSANSEETDPKKRQTLSELRAQIERLQTRGPREATSQRTRIDDAALADQLGAECLRPGVLAVDTHHSPGIAHGRGQLSPAAVGAAVEAFGAPVDGGPVVFADTETTGLAGGTGTTAFLLGLARLDNSGLQVRQYLLTAMGGEDAMLEDAENWLTNASSLVSFNGKSFDLPLLATRYGLLGKPSSLSGLPHVDLLHIVRRAFKGIWSDCRLQTAERRLLGYQRHDDLPGEQVPDAWFRWLRHGDWALLADVLRHNHDDLVSLAALLPALHDCYQDPVGWRADAARIARHRRKTGTAQETLCYLNENRRGLDASAKLELSLLAAGQRQWPLAVEIWHDLAQQNVAEAWERLAKYYEHRDRNFAQALSCAEALRRLAPEHAGHVHRERRIKRRMASQQRRAKQP